MRIYIVKILTYCYLLLKQDQRSIAPTLSAILSVSQSVNQSVNQPVSQSANQSIRQSVNPLTSQSVNQSLLGHPGSPSGYPESPWGHLG